MLTESDLEQIRAMTKEAMREVLAEVGLDLRDLITPTQAAEELSVGRTTIYAWLRDGKLQRHGKFLSRREVSAAIRDGLPIRRKQTEKEGSWPIKSTRKG